jgi:hypothetical protein
MDSRRRKILQIPSLTCCYSKPIQIYFTIQGFAEKFVVRKVPREQKAEIVPDVLLVDGLEWFVEYMGAQAIVFE